MPYCVNCGVELNHSEKNCPLCGVIVFNPAQPVEIKPERAYPARREALESLVDRQFWVRIVSILLAVPSLICILSNLLYDGTLSWSLYAVGGIVVLWAFGISPFLFKKPAAIKWIIIDTVAVLGYLGLIDYFAGKGSWFLPVALPIVLGMGIMTLLLTILIQRRVLKDLYIAAAVVIAVGIVLIGVEIVLDMFLLGNIQIIWSWFVLISCVAVALLFIFVERQKKLKEELKRRLHI